VLRESTVRSEMEYVRYEPKPKDHVLNAVRDLIPKLQSEMQPQDRILVYVPFKDMARTLAKVLGGQHYTGFEKEDPTWRGIPEKVAREQDTELKDSTMADFRAGKITILVATSALSAGYDYPHVRHVFAIVRPDSMLDLVQELHRGGRDGQHCVAHLMPAMGQRVTKVQVPDLVGVQASWDMFYQVTKKTCLRLLISAFCDKQAQTCKRIPGAYHCSGCKEGTGQGKFHLSHCKLTC
jgi:superfamily II DNA helicase RecQ